MKERARKTAIDIIGDVPWGRHFCQFYQTKEDLIDIFVPYFKAGLESNEFCMWITSEPLNAEEAKRVLVKEVKGLDDYIKKGQIEVLDYTQSYTKSPTIHGTMSKFFPELHTFYYFQSLYPFVWKHPVHISWPSSG